MKHYNVVKKKKIRVVKKYMKAAEGQAQQQQEREAKVARI